MFQLLHGDCIEQMRAMPDNSVDAVVTDPPYELGFMGKHWDASGIAFNTDVWVEVLRVLKPGGHLLAFSGSRTYHRMAVAIEDAGFEIRDQIMWLYGSGFPKSLDVSKAIDKAAGHWRGKAGEVASDNGAMAGPNYERTSKGNPITRAAREWQGWGTALKPAHEPIVVARKPLTGTVAANVLAYGTGALNIEGCRVGTTVETWPSSRSYGGGTDYSFTNVSTGPQYSQPTGAAPNGRWPGNVIHDGSDEVLDGFPTSKSGIAVTRNGGGRGIFSGMRNKNVPGIAVPDSGYTDSGSAARFFYCAKASKRDRNEGVQLCTCKEKREWLDEDLQVQRPADTGQSAPKATDASGTLDSGDSAWSTTSSGSSSTDQSPLDSKSTISTATNSTTTSQTLLPSIQSPINDSTPAASSTATPGSSLAVSATNTSLSSTNTGTSAAKAGRSTGDAAPATSASSSTRNANAGLQCADCGGIRGGHPTVKPTDLMRYLVRLVTPPNGTVLDPFTGSGSTGKACMYEGFQFVGIEQDADYIEIARARITWAWEQMVEAAVNPQPDLFDDLADDVEASA